MFWEDNISRLNGKIEGQKCSAVLDCSINIFHIWRPPCVSIGSGSLFSRISPLPLSLLFQFLSIFSLLPDRSLAPAGNKIQGLARRHCELLTPSSFTRPGFACVMSPSIFHDSVFHSRSVWFDKHKLLDDMAFKRSEAYL
jgi:hypothetical protein